MTPGEGDDASRRHLLVGAAFFCALACIVVVALAAGRPGEARAAFPGANGQIAFERQASDCCNVDIWVINPDGSGETNLTNTTDVQEFRPEFSPDATQIAYDTGYDGGVWLMDADGSNRRLLADGVGHATWSPDGTMIAAASSPDGIKVFRTSDGQLINTLTALGDNAYYYPAWRPTAPAGVIDIAVIKFLDTGFRDIVRLTESGEVDVTGTPGNYDEGQWLDWSPAGDRILYRFTSNTEGGIIAVNLSGGRELVQEAAATGEGGGGQAFSPDGGTLVYDDAGGAGSMMFTKPLPAGASVPLATGANPSWGVGAEQLKVDLTGTGEVSTGETFKVQLTLRNGETALDNVALADGANGVGIGNGGFPEGDRGTLRLISGPQPPIPDRLAPGETSVHTIVLAAGDAGRVAAYAKATGTEDGGDQRSDGETLIVDVVPVEVDDDWATYGAISALDKYWVDSFANFFNDIRGRAGKLKRQLASKLSAAERKLYFGDKKKVEITAFERYIADRRNLPPEFVALTMPNKPVKEGKETYTIEELDATYWESFNEGVGDGFAQYVEGYKKLGRGAKKLVTDTGSELGMTWRSLWGSATTEERAQIQAQMVSFFKLEGGHEVAAGFDNTVTTALRETFRSETYQYAGDALYAAYADSTLQSDEMRGLLAQQELKERNILKLAGKNPVAFQKASAEMDAEIFSFGMSTVLDQMVGGAVMRLPGAAGAVIKGEGRGMMVLGRSTGVLKPNGAPIKAPATSIEPVPAGGPKGMSALDHAQLQAAGSYLDETEDAVVIRTGAGNVYELPNIGGVPLHDIQIKQGILGELQAEYAAVTGRPAIELVEVLKPSSPLRKAGSYPKLEANKPKTGKPAMVDAGMPPEALAEANVWTAPKHPRTMPGFESWGKPRQQAAISEWKAANKAWDEYQNPAPGSPMAALKKAVGSRTTIPLSGGGSALQREVVAEFEEVLVKGDHGARAALLRVKYYEERAVIDGNIVNSRVIVNSKKGLPQGPDADAVGIGKLVDGKVVPLTGAEKNFFMPRYRAKTTAAAKQGNFAGAEHGATLVMDDAGTASSGFLLGKFGLGFMREEIARPFAARISPFTGMSADKLLALTGGEFGQKAVVVRASVDAYYGEVPFGSW